MTDDEYERWLRSDRARRTVLLEIDSNPVRRLAVVPYTTLPTDPTPNVRYDALVAGGVGYSETLALDRSARASHGSISLENTDGRLDSWIGGAWHNRAIRIYYGDISWPRSDFRLVAAGVVDSVEQSGGGMSIALVDAAERLSAAISDTLVGGGGQQREQLMPVTLGECHNITPVLFDAAQHEYRFHTGGVERIIEVRDSGRPVDFVAVGNGFRLTATPGGTITASVQGDNAGGYRNTVAALCRHLATAYGPASTRFTAADLDDTNLTAFEAAHPQPVGVYLPSRATVLQTVVDLAAAVGAQPVMSRTGRLRLLKVQALTTAAARLMPSDYEHGSLQIAGQTDVVAGVRLGYCRQWTPGQQILEGIPAEHRELFAQEWLTAVARAPAVAAEHRIDQEAAQVNVALLRRADAQAEAARRLALWSVPRTVVRVRAFAQAMQLELGQAVTLYGSRFGLDAGRVGQVVGLRPDWTAGRCDVEVLI